MAFLTSLATDCDDYVKTATGERPKIQNDCKFTYIFVYFTIIKRAEVRREVNVNNITNYG
jgi:hypothetical protein